MLTKEELCREICMKRCRYTGGVAEERGALCSMCPVREMIAPSTWYSYPDYTPPAGSMCLLANLERSRFTYTIGVYREDSHRGAGFYSPFLSANRLYPNGWQGIRDPTYFLQKINK